MRDIVPHAESELSFTLRRTDISYLNHQPPLHALYIYDHVCLFPP